MWYGQAVRLSRDPQYNHVESSYQYLFRLGSCENTFKILMKISWLNEKVQYCLIHLTDMVGYKPVNPTFLNIK